MADGVERELLLVDATEVRDHYDTLAAIMDSLLSLRRSLESTGQTLRLEIRRVFRLDLPSPDEEMPAADLAAQTVIATATLRAALHHAVYGLCRELDPSAVLPSLASTEAGKRAASERLRREVWMFTQVLRAFIAKAKQPEGDPNRWSASTSFHFVGEFLRHFRAIGYQLLRVSDYERLDEFMAALERLRDVDFLDPQDRNGAIEECTAFFEYMDRLFAQVSRRRELENVPFDKRAATETLRLYLGAA
jgi:hypothetical protein